MKLLSTEDSRNIIEILSTEDQRRLWNHCLQKKAGINGITIYWI